MAFVTDNHDPSGLGMFSKVGRFTSEKYIIFQKKDEILFNKRKFLKVSTLPNLDLQLKTEEDKNDIEFDKKEELLEILPHSEKENKKQKALEVKKPEERHRREETQPFFKMLPRNKVEARLAEKHPPPPCGYYKPKYTEIDRHPHLIWDYLKVAAVKSPMKSLGASKTSMKSSIAPLISSTSRDEDFFKPIAERLKPKIVGPVGLAKQGSRNNLAFLSSINPHEARFKVLKLSETWSNMRKTPSFNIRSKLGREVNKMYLNKEFAPDYNPNFEYGKEKMGKQIIPFQKMTSRKYVPKRACTTNENFFDWDYYTKTKNSHVYRKIITPDFKKQLPREADSNAKLPGFMQKYLNTRMTITLLSQKMIEMNNYMDGNFQGIYSSFKTPIKKVEKEEDESVSLDDQD